MKSVAWKIVAKKEANTRAATIVAVLSVRRRNIDSGRRGDAARRSTSTKAMSSTAPRMRKPTTSVDVQPCSMLWLMA